MRNSLSRCVARTLVMSLSALVLFISTTGVRAQNADEMVARSSQEVYRLQAQSSYRNGCFDPCDCVTDIRSPLDGTMILTRRPSTDRSTRLYTVSDVNFKINVGGAEQLVRGSGQYTWTSSIGPLTVLGHRLELELRVGDGPTQRFDSGLIPGASDGAFPPINIIIDKNDQICTDEVLTIVANPVPRREILPYCLTRESEASEGCFPPCLCPIMLQGAITGQFQLVKLPPRIISPGPLPQAPTEYAVIRVKWLVISPVAPLNQSITGSGFYTVQPPTLIEGFESMRLALTVNADPERVFRSFESIFTTPPQPPRRIQADLFLNGGFCYDRLYSITASPCPVLSPISAGASEQPSKTTHTDIDAAR